jgi:deazaflavin-dependent oxidoreductase (nitroreductase family)
MADFNQSIIEEFRTNKGVVGGYFEGVPMLLLTTTGRRTGEPRTTPLLYTPDAGRYAVGASDAGADENPLWFYNLEAEPKATIEVGERRLEVRALVAPRPERDRLYAALTERWPGFAEYETKTDRLIPVVVLEPTDA